MAMHIQNRHEFSEDVRGRLDELVRGVWEYSSVEEASAVDGSKQIRYVLHDAAGNELCAVVARQAEGKGVTYAIEE
jgi:hypothetical protein